MYRVVTGVKGLCALMVCPQPGLYGVLSQTIERAILPMPHCHLSWSRDSIPRTDALKSIAPFDLSRLCMASSTLPGNATPDLHARVQILKTEKTRSRQIYSMYSKFRGLRTGLLWSVDHLLSYLVEKVAKIADRSAAGS